MNQRCATCKFWSPEGVRQGSLDADFQRGNCRRRAPSVGSYVGSYDVQPNVFQTRSFWPQSWAKDWCGEWSERAGDKMETTDAG